MNTFTLKCIALILMVLDHIGLYFDGAPACFRIIGRLSFPLFFFCMAWGYHYTHSRRLYLLRLYLGGIFMAFFSLFIEHYFPSDSEFGYGNHNIFVTMFLTCVLISIIEAFLQNVKRGSLLALALFFSQILFYIAGMNYPFNNLNGDILTAFIPNLALNEYGPEFVLLGVLMYFLRDKKEAFSVMYLLFCIYIFTSDCFNFGLSLHSILYDSCQCFMVLALPFMLHYNRQKGPGMKYFFYFFYPAHTFVLYYLANFVFC